MNSENVPQHPPQAAPEAAGWASASPRTLAQIIDSLPQAVFWKDREGRFLGCNRALATALGVSSPDQLIGKTDRDLAGPAPKADAYRADDLTVIESNTAKLHIFETLHWDDGSIHTIETSKMPLHDAAGKVCGVLGIFQDITESEEAKHRLLHSEALLRATLESIEDGVLVVSATGKVSHRNSRFLEIWGIPPSLVAADDDKRLLAFVAPQLEDPAQFSAEVEDIYRSGRRTHGVLRLRDGRIIERFSAPVDSPDSDEERVWIFRDITERIRAEESLRSANARLASLFRVAPGGIGLITGRILNEVNDTTCRMTGYSREELIGRDTRHLYPTGQDYAAVGTLYARLGEDPPPLVETRWRHKNGSILNILMHVVPLDHDHPEAGAMALAIDITERKHAEQQYQAIIQTALDGFWRIDPQGNIAEVNDAVCAMLGYRREELLGLGVSALETNDNPVALAAHLARIAETGHDRFEALLRHRNGATVAVDLSVNRVPPPAEGFFVFIRDITERKHRESVLEQRVRERTAELDKRIAEVEALNTRLRASEQAAAHAAACLKRTNADLVSTNRELESFSYSVSHDLRSPLRNIAGFVELLRKRTEGILDPESARYFGIIGTESVRMAALIDDLLAFSRIGRAELHPEPIDLAGLIGEVRSELTADLAGREVDWQIQPLPVVLGDRTLLRQVISNLLGNAVKFTRKQAHARIEIGIRPQPTEHGQTIFFVRDNGAGFDTRYIDKLFGVFQRLHNPREFEGTGIGLANVKRAIDRHGGVVWAEGSLGEGATFFFTLPTSPG